MKRWFFKKLCLFAYRRWAVADKIMPTGVPNNRDPDFPCSFYAPRPKLVGDFGQCEGDGHYLCNGCAHHVYAVVEQDDSELVQLNI